MYHFFVEQEQIGPETVTVTGSDVNPIKNVLRMKPGEEVLISSRDGGDYLCRVAELDADTVRMEILNARESSMELTMPSISGTLCGSSTKPMRM